MADFDYFLKIEGIEGESADATHKGELDVEAWSWGEAQTQPAPAGGGLGAGKVKMQDVTLTMRVSKASPKLFLACAEGNHIKAAWLTARRAFATPKGNDYFLKWTFSDVLVSSYQTGAAPGLAPQDQVSLSFSKIEVEYKAQRQDGSFGESFKAGWDVKANKKV